jgi:GT2 family glycosyltransferase
MKLSVVIVNYNVKYFLEQCLLSVQKAMKKVDGEIFVVDNNSVDGSVEMVREKFPLVNIVANKKNLGFAKANNQAIRMAKGEFILLLNPDTVVEDDTFEKVLAFMDAHPDAGGLGVKMLDGSGKFLPESKRGLPTPATAFYKIFGLSALFPHSRRFSKYHLGYLSEDEIHRVDILAGAFMLLRKSVLDKVGLLDEDFFMYGEDIDLSYRITKAGYFNYYFPQTRIIHYKGESTRKSSVNYVLVFYRAMVVFARKHFTAKRAGIFAFLIHIAIYFRAFLALLSRFFSRILLPVLDFLVLYGGALLVKTFWERNIQYPQGGHYPLLFTLLVLPVYVLVWLAAVYFSGGYDKPVRSRPVLTGMLSGTVLILVLYAMMPENLRFSRGQIIADMTWGLAALPLLRQVLHKLKVPGFKLGKPSDKRFLVIGEEDEARRVASILENAYVTPGFIGLISPDAEKEKPKDFIGNIMQVKDIISIFAIDEVIFCAKNISHQTIIDKMTLWKSEKVDFKIAPSDSLSIIGSHSINTQGELYTVDINSVDKPANRRSKRIFDWTFSVLFLLLFPFFMWIVKQPFGFLRNIFAVMAGAKTWVGYAPVDRETVHLPRIKPGVLSPVDAMKTGIPDADTRNKLNMLYARDYSIQKDVNILWMAFRHLGRQG